MSGVDVSLGETYYEDVLPDRGRRKLAPRPSRTIERFQKTLLKIVCLMIDSTDLMEYFLIFLP